MMDGPAIFERHPKPVSDLTLLSFKARKSLMSGLSFVTWYLGSDFSKTLSAIAHSSPTS